VVNFVGIQTAQTSLSFLGVVIILASLFFVLSIDAVQRVLITQVLTVAGTLVGSTLLIAVLRYVLLAGLTTWRDTIASRRLFALLDLYFTFFQLICGLVLALSRACFLVFVGLYGLGRPDIQLLPGKSYARLDPAMENHTPGSIRP
jgi:DMSO/TMAO reductase YedYZ heme-binding membrane subunit